jgi:putative ABC transport system permease protein
VRWREALLFALRAIRRYPARSSLMLLATAIGVAAVVVFTALGDSAGRYVRDQFGALGTNLLQVVPGRNETTGGGPAMFIGATPRDLTLADALALTRSSAVKEVVPMVVGAAPVSWRGREREVSIIGSTHGMLAVRRWNMAQGRFLPPGDPEQPASVAVIGSKLREELFGSHAALGEWIRIGEHRFRVIGVLATEGRSIGIDVQELALIPVASAQTVFNAPSLFRIMVEARGRDAVARAARDVVDILRERHQGEEDVTVVTQDAVLKTFDRVIGAFTYTIVGIAAISLAVAGILIMNVMLLAVTQRTPEIGLMKALGSPRRQILALFLAEAALLSVLGAVAGIAVGAAGTWAIGRVYPKLPLGVPAWGVLSALFISLATGLAFGLLPARRAARMDPVEALAHR